MNRGSQESQDASTVPWPEDTVEYRIYCSEDAWRQEDSLPRLAVECNFTCRQLSGHHVWHYSAFALRPAKKDADSPPHLMGRTCFRGNTHDEWFIVQLLLNLSVQHPDFVISLLDGDGQFLLIEASHHLEKWMQPEEMTNRVFLHRGDIHIIPKPRTPAEIRDYPVATPTLDRALELVRSEVITTRASSSVQECIKQRISRFHHLTLPHRAHCTLPSLAAHVIHSHPELVSAAYHALVDRTPADMQLCRKMETFSPRRYEMATCEVYFPRLLYAQLLHLQFSAPRSVGFNTPSARSSKFRECDLGLKLTCGLEILYHRAKAMGCEEISLRHHPKWPPFLQKLKRCDYFGSEVEGSQKYQEKLASAEDYFMDMHRHGDGHGDGNGHSDGTDEDDPLVVAGQKIMQTLKGGLFSEGRVKQEEADLLPPDDDSWLNVSEMDLDTMLKNSAMPLTTPTSHLPSQSLPGETPQSADSAVAPPPDGEHAADLQSMAYGMTAFLDKVSSHTGAEFPWSGNEPADCTPVDFDPDSCLTTMTSMLEMLQAGQLREESSDDGEEDSEGYSGDEGEEEVVEEVMTLMQQMDAELGATEVGKSFEKTADEKASDEPSSAFGDDHTPSSYTDRSLPEYNTSCTDQTLPNDPASTDHASTDPPLPVDVDFNLVKNLLESYTSQEGGAGPGSNILHSLGLAIPQQDS